jgi:methionine-rich copper-binding protein CopC
MPAPASRSYLRANPSDAKEENVRISRRNRRSRALLALAAAAIAVASAAAAAKVVHAAPRSASTSSALVADIAAARLATARYVNNLALARKDGYQIITTARDEGCEARARRM